MDTKIEKELLEQVRISGHSEPAVRALIDFYQRENAHEKVVPILVRQISKTEDIETAADCSLQLGLQSEGQDNFNYAALFYSYGLSLQPKTSRLLYFLNNNLGFSLNQLGRHAEAQAYCMTAIGLNPGRHNAFKNLGVALQGQGKHVEAARNYMQATRICPGDPRALNHLNALVAIHSEVISELDDEEDFVFENEPGPEEKTIH